MLGVYATADRGYMVSVAGALFVLWRRWEVRGVLCSTCSPLEEAAAVQRTEGQAGMGVFPAPLLSVVAEEGCLYTILSADCSVSLLHMSK